jgi:hypothetical protein
MLVRFDHQGEEKLLIFRENDRIMGPNDDDQIITAGQIVLKDPDGFAEEAFDAITADGGADAARNAQTPAALGQFVGLGINHQRPAGLFDAGGVNGGEWPAAT